MRVGNAEFPTYRVSFPSQSFYCPFFRLQNRPLSITFQNPLQTPLLHLRHPLPRLNMMPVHLTIIFGRFFRSPLSPSSLPYSTPVLALPVTPLQHPLTPPSSSSYLQPPCLPKLLSSALSVNYSSIPERKRQIERLHHFTIRLRVAIEKQRHPCLQLPSFISLIQR